MPYDVGLADRLRARGLVVRECDGWKTRGNSSGGDFHPAGLVVHHTAGPPPSAGKAPSLGTIIEGRSDLDGPLANLYMDYEQTIYVVAAGAANHAGLPDGGSYKGMNGNSDAWGFEIEHPGTSALGSERRDVAARAVAAVIDGTCGSSMVPYHKEWAPSRKIDLATSPSPGDFRARVAAFLDDPGGFLMALSDKDQQTLFDNAQKAARFASGVQQFWEAFKQAGNDYSKVKTPDSLDTELEWAGWKLADRLQHVREAQKAAGLG